MDTNLRRRIRAGDHDAFGDLFDAYARSVYNHAYRLTGDWASAEEVVSAAPALYPGPITFA